MTDENGYIRITNRELYDMLRKVQDQQIELISRTTDYQTVQGKMEARISKLETAAYGFISGIVGALGLVIYSLVKGK
jgi:hypothetical protein